MDIAAKLQIKPESRVVVLNQPDDVELTLPQGTREADAADAVILFVASREQLESRGGPFIAAAQRDSLAWIANPKAGQLETDLNRESLRERLGDHGIRPVRQVAIDTTWSALRFRPS